MNEPKPSFLERQRASKPWLDHLVRAGQRYQGQKGDYFAAGVTYFTVLALFPVLMVAFSIAGFVLVGHPEWLSDVKDHITNSASGDIGRQLNDLIDSAISARTSVGIIGLLGAIYSGLGWMANLREALTAQWDQQHESPGFLKTKIYDLGALIGLLLALIVSIGFSALSNGSVTRVVLRALKLDHLPGVGVAIQIASVVLSIVASWALFTWVISRLPREPVSARSAVKAGLLTAVVFEVFKQVAAVYLKAVTSGPAGATFGPIIGIMVFAFITARIILFATAWAATAKENMEKAAVAAPDPAIIRPRVVVNAAPSPAAAAGLVGAGALGACAISRWRRRG